MLFSILLVHLNIIEFILQLEDNLNVCLDPRKYCTKEIKTPLYQKQPTSLCFLYITNHSIKTENRNSRRSHASFTKDN